MTAEALIKIYVMMMSLLDMKQARKGSKESKTHALIYFSVG